MKSRLVPGARSRQLTTPGALRHGERRRGLVLDPGPPMAVQGDQPAGTAFEFFYGENINNNPRQHERVNFDTLRGMADVYGLLRLVIETRKDTLCGMAWEIRPKDEDRSPGPEAARIQTFLEMPDRTNDWDEWLRMLLEDMLVIDAPTIYYRTTYGGDLYALELIDGSTIKVLIDERGRLPEEGPAYQQVIRGLVTANFERDELIYRPRNPRIHKVYGYSAVEQIIGTVNTALRREERQLEYFTAGGMPDAVASVPKEWTTDQIRQFQNYWNDLMSQAAERRRTRFIPDGTIFKQLTEPPLKDMFDEWLARLVCFAFGQDPNPLIAQINRSVAESAREQTAMEGVGPHKRWVATTMNAVLRRMGVTDHVFAWKDDAEPDPETKSTILERYWRIGALSPNEIREEIGREARDDEGGNRYNEGGGVAAAGSPPQGGSGNDGAGGQPPGPQSGRNVRANQSGGRATKGAGFGPGGKPGERTRPEQGTLTTIIADLLEREAERIAVFLTDGLEKIDDPEALRRRLQRLELDWSEIVGPVAGLLEPAIADAAGETFLSAVATGPEHPLFHVMRERAQVYSRWRAAELVGMRFNDRGQLIPNPNAQWQITETTRESIARMVDDAIENGRSAGELARQLRESHTFSRDRADMIARTEIAHADGGGAQLGAEVAGAQYKRWTTSQDDRVTIQCQADAAAGRIAIDERFPSGALHPPGHVRCRCALVYYFTEDEDE